MRQADRRSYDARESIAAEGDEVPLEARIVRLADTYDSLTAGHGDSRGVTPLEAKNIIARESGTEFDPTVVHAFKRAFRQGELETPEPVGTRER
jgi:response regulator RpfG family c-di-GMP phosphodiesterase